MISICMATYNGSKYIQEQISSILPQLSEYDELVISDDGSTDKTLNIVYSFHDYRIKIFHNEEKSGVVPNFENALCHANGDYIFLCDQDDVWMEDKVSKVMSVLQDCDFVIHNAEMVDGSLNPLGIDFFSLRNTRYGYIQNIYKMRYLGCCIAFKRNALKYILPFPKGILWHDMWAAAILHLKFHGKLIHEPLICYRRHGNNASPSGENSNWSLRFRIAYRWTIFVNSILRILL